MKNHSFRRLVSITLLAWLAMMVLIFFTACRNPGSVLRSSTSIPPSAGKGFSLNPTWLPCILLIGILVVWLSVRLEILGWKPGLLFGFQLGALIWAALTLS